MSCNSSDGRGSFGPKTEHPCQRLVSSSSATLQRFVQLRQCARHQVAIPPGHHRAVTDRCKRGEPVAVALIGSLWDIALRVRVDAPQDLITHRPRARRHRRWNG